MVAFEDGKEMIGILPEKCRSDCAVEAAQVEGKWGGEKAGWSLSQRSRREDEK